MVFFVAALLSALVSPAGKANQLVESANTVIVDVRSFVAPTNEARLAELTKLLEREHLPFTTHKFVTAKGGAGTNVFVDLGKGETKIVVSAHYDAAKIPEGRLADGVIDNAAGVVALVRAADRLKSEPLHHHLRFVFFDQEELGLLGSKAYLAKRKDRIAANLNVDVVGYGDTPIFGNSVNGSAGDLATSVFRQACRERECLFFPKMPPSDDANFTASGIPAVLLSMLPALEAHQLWLLMNGGAESGLADNFEPATLTRIHTADDRIEHVDEKAIDTAADLIVDWVRIMDRKLSSESK